MFTHERFAYAAVAMMALSGAFGLMGGDGIRPALFAIVFAVLAVYTKLPDRN